MLNQSSIKFLVDESVEYGIVVFLRDLGFDVYSVSEEKPSIPDTEVLFHAFKQRRVLITNDKGFSALVFKEKRKSYGAILIRLPFASTQEKIRRLQKTLGGVTENFSKVFTTLTEKRIRSRRLP